MANTTLIIPAYNEGERIGKTLNSIHNAFGDKVGVVVVNNGSSDSTADIVKKWGEKHKNVGYVDYPAKLGKGGAILEGLKSINNKYIGYLDADDAFDIKYIKKMLEQLKKEDYDTIIASKWIGVSFGKVTEPIFRKILSRGWNLLVRFILGLKFKDTQAGAKFFKGKALASIEQDFMCRNFAFDIELLYRLKKKNFKIKEVYVPTTHMGGSKFKLRYSFAMFNSLIKLWWNRSKIR